MDLLRHAQAAPLGRDLYSAEQSTDRETEVTLALDKTSVVSGKATYFPTPLLSASSLRISLRLDLRFAGTAAHIDSDNIHGV